MKPLLVLVLLMGAAAAAGCTAEVANADATVATGGDPVRGRAVIGEFACGACHTIPGIRNARGLVGPPLTAFGRRSFIAGRLPNTPANVARWVRNPRDVDPHTAMPMLGLDETQARDVAAYLYTLR